MRRALPRGLVGAPGATLLLGAAGLLLAAALFFSEASSPERLAWIGGAAILAAGASGAAALFGVLPVPRLGREGVAFVVLLAALVAWIGASIAWSAAPDRSWDNFNRGAVYLAFAVLGLLVAAVEPRAPRRVAGGLAALLAGVAVWALAGKVVPALYDDYGRFARLRSPVGYWNGLALLCALGLPLALWLAARRAHGLALRVAGVVLAYALVVAVFLTYSRGGLAAAAFAIGAWLVLTEERFESVGALAVALPSAIAVVALGLSLPGVAEDRQPRDVRVEDGAWFGVALVVGAILVAGLAVAAGRYEARRPLSAARRRLLLRGAAVAGAVAILVGGAALAVWGAGVNADVVPQDPSRIGAAGSNNRLDWWQEAWEAFEGEPLLGTGAGSFELVHRQLRDRPSNDVTEPHNLALRFLSETGLVGFLLTAGTAAAGLAGAWRALGRLEGDEREAAAALAVGVPTYLLHGLVDFDWDFVAVSAPVFFVLGLLLGRPGERLRRPLWAVGSALVALTALSSIAAPWLAERKVDEAYAAIERPEEAVDAARAAHRLNPLAVEPLLAWATAEEARGNVQRAGELYVEAVELQPLNAETWYELARFEIDQGDQERARRHLERARELDPFFAAAISLLNLIGAGE